MTLISIPAPVLDGTPIEVDSAKLSDPTGTFGVRRTDTLDVIVPDGTDLEFIDGDTYQYEFEGETDVSYEAWFEYVLDGEVYRSSLTITAVEVVGTKTLTFVAIKNGELVEFDELPVLSSPSNQYGVKRLGDNEIMLAAGSQLLQVGDSLLYARTFDETTENAKYKFYVVTNIDDVEYIVPSTNVVADSAMLAIGRYTDSTRISARFGVDNMHLWLSTPLADVDDPVDYARRAWEFISDAERRVDEAIYGPFVSGAFTGDIPAAITQAATELAGVLMYEARGIDDVNTETNEPMHRLRYVKRDVQERLRRINMGLIKISGDASVVPHQIPLAGGDDPTYSSDIAHELFTGETSES